MKIEAIRARLRPGMLVIVLCVGVVAAASLVSARVFDHVPHVEDEVAFVFQARAIAGGQLLADRPVEPAFFFAPFVIVRDGDWFGKYPPGFPAVLALGALVDRPWLVNPLVAAGCVALLYLVSRRLYGSSTALLAAVLLAVSPFFLLQAGSLMSHVVSLFWTLLFMLLFARAYQQRSTGAAALAGGAMGLLVLTRPWTALAVGLPFAVWAVVELARRRDRATLLRYVAMGLAFAPFVVLLLLWNEITTGDPTKSAYELWWKYDRIGFGDGIGVDGHHSVGEGLEYARMNIEMLMDYLYGWPARLSVLPAVFACLLALLRMGRAAGKRPWGFVTSRVMFMRRLRAGVARTFATRRPGEPRPALDAWDGAGDATAPRLAWDLLLVGIVVSLVVLHIAYSTPGQMYGPRYYFEALGALALLSARGLLQFGAMLGQLLQPLARAPGRARALATTTVLLVALMLSGYGYDSFARDEFDAFVGWNNIDRDGLREVEAADLSHAIVFVDAPKWTDFAPFFVENDPALDADVIYALDLGTRRNQDLMRHYPGRSFYRYTDGRLVPVRGLGAGR